MGVLPFCPAGAGRSGRHNVAPLCGAAGAAGLGCRAGPGGGRRSSAHTAGGGCPADDCGEFPKQGEWGLPAESRTVFRTGGRPDGEMGRSAVLPCSGFCRAAARPRRRGAYRPQMRSVQAGAHRRTPPAARPHRPVGAAPYAAAEAVQRRSGRRWVMRRPAGSHCPEAVVRRRTVPQRCALPSAAAAAAAADRAGPQRLSGADFPRTTEHRGGCCRPCALVCSQW